MTPDSNATFVVRSSPRVIAPDWRNRIRQAPVIVWIAMAFVIVLICVTRPSGLPRHLDSAGAYRIGRWWRRWAKALNARVFITPDYVES